jgi:hypothetical protein
LICSNGTLRVPKRASPSERSWRFRRLKAAWNFAIEPDSVTGLGPAFTRQPLKSLFGCTLTGEMWSCFRRTRAIGIGIQLSSQKVWSFTGSVTVVENADAFWQHERVLPDADMAILGSGNMSSRLLEWLASPAMSRCRIIHWGDYDPVGVCQYLRLVDACPGRVDSFAPPEIDLLLPQYGKRKLVTQQPTFLDRLRRPQTDLYVRRMVELFDEHRRGLEQEVLLLRQISHLGGVAPALARTPYAVSSAPGRRESGESGRRTIRRGVGLSLAAVNPKKGIHRAVYFSH